MLDLLQTGKYGVLTQQKMLGTTSNNITNVNTSGYVRQETVVYTSAIEWGIGATVTRRLYDQYVQREMFRDQGNVGFYDSYATGLSTVDNLLSNEDTAVSTSLDNLFSTMQTAVQNTTSIASRRDLLTKFETLVDRYHTLNYNINNELKDINSKIDDAVTTINDLVEAFYETNRQVRNLSNEGLQSDVGLQLLDKRDQLVNELSNYVDINVTTESDGSYSLYLGNGQLLVNGDTYATLKSNKSPQDGTRREISITFNNTQDKTEITLDHDSWGGKLGGYLAASDEMRQAMRDLGQSAMAFADAMNEQNKGGVTLENLAGKNIITMPDVKAATNNDAYGMTVSFNPGEGADIHSCDYEVSFSNGQVNVFMVDSDGNKTQVEIDPANISNPAGGGPLVIDLEGHGITMTFNSDINTMEQAEVKFYAQPTLNAAFDMKLNITKPEEFAFASAIRVNTNGHAGNAVAELEGVFGTSPVDDNSEFGLWIDPATGKADWTENAPNFIQYEGDEVNGQYVIYHKDSETGNLTRLGFALNGCNGQAIFENTTWFTPSNPDPYPVPGSTGTPLPDAVNGTPDNPSTYPGYEVNFTGTVVNGSSFEIELNTDGYNDNSNGNLIAQLQQEDLVYSTGSVRTTFTEAYADLTSAVGSAVMSATTDLAAATAKCEQSQSLFSSTAGVNLDEEAANLIRYQQSYSACARIINASQTIFDALLTAMM